MFKISSKLLFLFILILGTIITISATSWLGAWMGLEINLLAFIPLMINNNNMMSNEAALKYFLTQAMASAMLLFSIIMKLIILNLNWFNNMNEFIIMMMINSILLLKMGAAPFHFWFPGVMEGLTWFNNFILMTWQKLAPMILLSYYFLSKFILMIIISSAIIGALGGLNQISLHKLMAYSSINHLAWLLTALMYSQMLWLIYFMIYSLLSMTLIYLFHSYQLFNLNKSFSMFSNNNHLKFMMFLSLLSLGGLPPFLGFLPKWLVIQNLTPNYFLLFIMVSLTLITLYFYLRIFYSAIMLNYWQTSWNFYLIKYTINMKISLFMNYFMIFGLSIINIIYFM